MTTTTTLIRKTTTGEPGNGGEFGSHRRADADAVLTPVAVEPLRSDFIDASVANQEAAAAYQGWYPGATAEDVENILFDTWDTADEYEGDLADPNSGLQVMNGSGYVQALLSGGVAVFWA